jgi:hypothetical protein
MTEPKTSDLCGCASLWITVENPVDKPVFGEQVSPPHAPPFQDKDLSFMRHEMHELVAALTNGLELANARIEALETAFDEIFSVLERPLTLTESIEQLRLIRERIGR